MFMQNFKAFGAIAFGRSVHTFSADDFFSIQIIYKQSKRQNLTIDF